jgi:hypothetical protein
MRAHCLADRHRERSTKRARDAVGRSASGQNEPRHSPRQNGRSTSVSGPRRPTLRASESGQKRKVADSWKDSVCAGLGVPGMLSKKPASSAATGQRHGASPSTVPGVRQRSGGHRRSRSAGVCAGPACSHLAGTREETLHHGAQCPIFQRGDDDRPRSNRQIKWKHFDPICINPQRSFFASGPRPLTLRHSP